VAHRVGGSRGEGQTRNVRLPLQPQAASPPTPCDPSFPAWLNKHSSQRDAPASLPPSLVRHADERIPTHIPHAPGGGRGRGGPARCCPGCAQSSRGCRCWPQPRPSPALAPAGSACRGREQRAGWGQRRRAGARLSTPRGGSAVGTLPACFLVTLAPPFARQKPHLRHQLRHAREGRDAARRQLLVQRLLGRRHRRRHLARVPPILPAGGHRRPSARRQLRRGGGGAGGAGRETTARVACRPPHP
jgi:hypothetical protein